ncbi:MAG: RHS repeat-associated core domain-containing protein [Clostridia bacterium]|nr:RHS repeat-associated core domain-containing protein [Clostridia bacterium]
MNRLESLGFIKWRVIAVLLIITLTIQLIPSRFADLIRSKVCASEESVFCGNEYPDLIPEVSIEEDNTDISKDKKGLSVNGELTDLRSRHSKTYRLSDGSFYSTQFSYPIHIIEDDRWIDVDNTLISDPDCGRVKNTKGVFNVSFPQIITRDKEQTEENSISVSGEQGGISYTLSLPGLTNGPSYESFADIIPETKDENTQDLSVLQQLELLPALESGLKYSNITDGISLEYTVTPGGIKENIMLESAPSVELLDQGFLYSFDTKDLIPELEENRIIFLNEDGYPVCIFSAPLMYDSAGAVSDNLTLSLEEKDDGLFEVRLLADTDWIMDSKRVFPIVIDPEVTVEDSEVIDSAATFDSSDNSVAAGVAVAGANKHAAVRLNWPELPPFALPVEANFRVNHGAVNYSDCYLSATAVNENWTVSGLANGLPAHEQFPFQHFHHMFYASSYFTLDVTGEAKKNYIYAQNYGFLIESSGLTSPATLFYASNIEATVLTLRYLNYQGLEEQWNTHAASVSDMSGTIYVKDAFGDFVYVHDDLTTPGDVLPLSVSHIFNFTDGKDEFGYGYGFRLSLCRTLEFNPDIDGYIYTDEDGTKHYFLYSSQNEYLLEEDHSVKIKTDSGIPYIVWPDSSRLTFGDSQNNILYASSYTDYRDIQQTFQYTLLSGRKLMTKAIDGAGNYLQFTYNSSGMLTGINVNGSTTRKLTFTYDSGKLSRITYPDSSYTEFYSTSRTVNGKAYYYPKRIVDPSGVMMRVAVSSGTLRVSKIYKKAAGSGDSTVVDADYALFTYEPSRTTVKYGFGSHETGSEIISFDYYGRAVNALDDKGNSVILNYDDTNNVFNNINKVHSELTAGPNYLKNSSFEYASLLNWSLYSGSSSAVKSAEYIFPGLCFGSNVMKLTSNQSSGYTGYVQSLSLSSGTYTASVYCNASSGTGSGGAVIAFIYNDASGITQTVSSIPEKGNGRMQVTFTVPAGTSSQKLLLGTYNYTGTVYFDAAQVETGGRASYYNAVENGGALYSVSGNWSGDISITTTAGRSGYVLYLSGSTAVNRSGEQRIYISKTDSAKQYIRLSGWYKAPNYYNVRNANIQVSFYNSSGSIISGKTKTVYPDNNLTDWQYLSESFSVNFPYSYVKITLNNYGPGYVYFDDVSLIAETSYEDFDIDAEYTYNQFGWVETETAADRSVTDHTYYTDSASSLFGRIREELTADKYGNETFTEYIYSSYYNEVTDLQYVTSVYTPSDDDLEPVTTVTEYQYGNENTDSAKYCGHPTLIFTKVREGNGNYSVTEYSTKNYRSDMLLSSETDLFGTVTSYSYNSYGELTSVTQNGSPTTYTYDSMGRVTGTSGKARVGTTNNSTVSVSFAYNAGRLGTITRSNSYYGLNYDSLGRSLSVTVNRTSGGNTSSTAIANYTYSSSNGLVSRLTYGNGKYKDYTYNAAGQVTAIDYSGTSGTDYTNTYSNAGDAITRYNSLENITKSYSYDSSGRPVYTAFSNGKSLKYTYLDKNDESSVTFRGLAAQPDKFNYRTYPAQRYTQTGFSGNVTTEAYRYFDEFGRLSYTKAGNSAILKTDLTYLTAGTYLDQSTFNYYSKLTGRVGSVSFTKKASNSNSYVSVSGLPTLTYTYDAKGNIETISEGGVLKVKYYYDAQNQLIREDNKYLNNGDGYTVEYRYNADGNMTAKLPYAYTTGSTFPYEYSNSIAPLYISYSASNGWRDQMTSYNGNTVTYDGAGNILSYNNGASMTLTWTQGNRLASVNRAGTTSSYLYDENGYRTRKTVGSTVYTYIWDGERLVSQDTGTAGSEIVFLYDDSGNMFGFRRANTVYYYAKNLQGDVIAILNSSMNVVAKYTYDSWGKLISIADGNGNNITNSTSTIGYINPIRYRSYYYDNEAGLYYLKSRYYDPEINRFMSADLVIGSNYSVIGYNMYIYCSNNPVNFVDPSGNIPIGLIIAALFLFTPVGGTALQIIASAVSYLGMLVVSVFDKEVRDDLKSIKYNPFNVKENKVLSSQKVSFYKGVPVFRTNGKRSGTFGGIFLKRGETETELKHERGHSWQLMMMGIVTYAITVAIPSAGVLGGYDGRPDLGREAYYYAPWETMADILGGTSHGQSDKYITDAWIYYITGHLIIPAFFWWGDDPK